MKLIKKTKSRCPECLKIIDASVCEKEDGVWMYKECDKHGKSEGFIEKDVKLYKTMMNEKEETVPCRIVVVPITHRCNLNCKFCYVPKRDLREKTTEELKEEIRKIIKETDAYAITLAGGEPTLREDLFELVKFISDEYPSKCTAILTNGLKLVDLDYVKKIKESGAIVTFSFNGFDEKVYQEINNTNLLNVKLEALKNLKEMQIPTTLSPTIFRGLNENELKNIVQYALNNLDFIFEIRIRGGARVGRHGDNKPLQYSEMLSLVTEAFGKDRDYFLKRFSRDDCYHSIHQFLIRLIIDDSSVKKEILGFIYDRHGKNTINNKINKMVIFLKVLARRGIGRLLSTVIKAVINRGNYKNYSEAYKNRLLLSKIDIRVLNLKMWWWTDRTNLDLNEMKAANIMHQTYDGRVLSFFDAIIMSDEL